MLCRGDVSGAGVACSVAGTCRPSAEEFFCLGRSRDTGDAGAANPDGSRTPPPRGITCGPRFRQLPVRAGDSHQPPGTSPHVQGCGSGLRAGVAVTLAAILWPEPSPATGPRTHVSGDPGSSALSAFGAGAPPAAGSQTRPRRRPAPPLRRKRVASGAVCGPRGVPWPPEARPPAQCRLGLGAEGGPGGDADQVWGAPPASRRASRELAA